MGVKTTLIEIDKRSVKVDDSLKIFLNGEGNDYPERMERYINNSITAKSSSTTMTTFLAGKGFGEAANKLQVNKKNSLLVLTHKAGRSISRQRGVFYHVNYNLDLDIDYINTLPYSHCRKGKKDDNNYNGKILVSPDWTKTDDEANKPVEFDVYNPKKSILEAQIDAAKGENLQEKIKNYKGQVLFIELDGEEEEYPLSSIDAVQLDCDSEAQASIFKNRGLRKGFFGKTLVVTPPMVDIDPTDEDSAKEYHEQEGERREFRKSIQGFIGAENNEGVLHIELEYDGAESLDKAILFKNIEANIDDKVFAHTETSVSNNIRYAFNNIPALLVRDNTGAMFGQSGEGIREAKEYYQEQTTMERAVLVSSLTGLLSRHVNFKGIDLVHVPLVDTKDTTIAEGASPEVSDDTAKAQAALRGSVGGYRVF